MPYDYKAIPDVRDYVRKPLQAAPGDPQPCDYWWDSLTDQERIWWAAKAAGADSDVLYAIEKPWKYAELAYQEQQERR